MLMRSSRVWMRSSRMVRAAGCQCQSRNSPWIRSQHPPTQWNLRGGRWSSVEYSTQNKKIPKIPLLTFAAGYPAPAGELRERAWRRAAAWGRVPAWAAPGGAGLPPAGRLPQLPAPDCPPRPQLPPQSWPRPQLPAQSWPRPQLPPQSWPRPQLLPQSRQRPQLPPQSWPPPQLPPQSSRPRGGGRDEAVLPRPGGGGGHHLAHRRLGTGGFAFSLSPV